MTFKVSKRINFDAKIRQNIWAKEEVVMTFKVSRRINFDAKKGKKFGQKRG